MSDARAYVDHDFGRDGISIWLGRFHGDQADIVQPAELVFQRTDRTEGATVEGGPSLRLPEDIARALLDALVAHYGGHSDMRRLRADYDQERKRVDKMIDHLIEPNTWRRNG